MQQHSPKKKKITNTFSLHSNKSPEWQTSSSVEKTNTDASTCDSYTKGTSSTNSGASSIESSELAKAINQEVTRVASEIESKGMFNKFILFLSILPYQMNSFDEI